MNGGSARGMAYAGALLVVVGIVLAGTGVLLTTSEGSLTGSAVPVDATVLNATLDRERDGRATPVVEYRYEFDGETYTGDDVFRDASPPVAVDRARDIVADYPENTTVTAYVDADSPGDAHLIPDPPSPLYYVLIAVGVLVTLAGVVATVDRLFGIR